MRAVAGLLLLFFLAAVSAEDDPLVVRPGQSVTGIIDAYRDLGYPFVYSTNLVPESLRVLEAPAADDPVDIVREILAPHGLTVQVEAELLLIVRADRERAAASSILLIVTGGDGQSPVVDASIRFDPALGDPELVKPGVYEFGGVAPGRYELGIDADGFAAVRRVVDVWPGDSRIVNVRLAAEKPVIETIAVSASRYEILREIAPSQFSIDQRAIQTMPDIGDDPLRIVQRLPGAAASGASAKTHLRGGERGEIGILLNGQKLFDPFHVRDYQSIFSAIDSRALEGVEVYTGGFPVRYGNRMSGMVLMESLDPLTPRHTEVGLSVYNTSLLTAGNDADRHWLFSARRGNLDLVINPELGSPAYFDTFAEFAIDLSPNTTLSLNALYASDRVEIVLESDPDELERVVSETDNVQVWMQIDNRWSEALSSKTILSATWFDNLRRGSLGDEEKIVASLFDDRRVLQFGLRQDFQFHPSDDHLLQWGLQVRQSDAEYAYRSRAEYFELQSLYDGRDEPLVRDLTVDPEGASYALYFSDRWRLNDETTLEWGLRWDDQTYTDLSSDSQLSPRISLLRSAGRRTDLRLSWGRYHQSQEINELQIEDGITNFWPAQRADHWIAGIRHRFDDRHGLRLELFRKNIADLRPRFENLFDPLGLIPEVQPDRVRLDPSSARAEGVELSFYRNAGPLDWWATYVWSEVTDRIDGRDELRSWDQRHAFQGGVNFSNEKWEWGVALNVHSGWPLTELTLVEDGLDEDGETVFRAVPGSRNAGRHASFASLDLRIARKWQLPRGSLMAFLEISNALDRNNPCCLDWDLEEDDDTGSVSLERGRDYWMPVLPAIGVLWEF
ncbi:MAG: TonB-dependent receptor [Woeseiaceae bacterium]|nr:TonB-dependent receptor [Woeseiaceae bacterium]